VPTISLRHSVGVCGLHAPLSVLNDVMLYGAFRTKSLKSVLKQMAGLCSTNASEPDALLTVAGKATITAVAPADPGLDHTIELDLTLTNPGGKTVDIHDASLILADSGGYPLMRFGLFGQNTIFENSSPPIGAGGSFAGSKIFGWGGNPFHFIVSIHASDSGGKRQHLIRHVPILRSGFAAPQNLAVPGPVYVGLWERPVEIVNLLHNGAPTQWLTAGGQIVNVARSQVKITIDSLSFALLSENGDEQDLFAQNWFYDQNGKLLTPNPDGRVPFFAFAANFVFGFPVTVKGAKPTLRVDLLYTIDDQGKTSQGKATTVLPVSVVTPAIVASPLRTPKNVNWDWNWGNAPDHTTWTDQNGSPTGFDSHANFGEHYCYDITGIDSSTNRSFAGTCTWSGSVPSGDCTKNSSFFDYKQPIFAVKAGTVVLTSDGNEENNGFKGNPATANNRVVIDHGDGTITGYFHMAKDSVLVSQFAPGDAKNPKNLPNMVSAGQKIGLVGNSDGSSEPHLHFGLSAIHATGRARRRLHRPTDQNGTPVTVVPGNGRYRS
jgi:Peptidase family M23